MLFQYPNLTELTKFLGVKVEEIKSTPLKAAPSMFEPASPEARAAVEAIVMDSYDWFRGLVRDNRKIEGTALATVTDGRVFTGRQAIDLKLVDELGDEKQAVAWLAREKGIDPKTRVRNYELEVAPERPAIPACRGGRSARSDRPEGLGQAHRSLGYSARDRAPQP